MVAKMFNTPIEKILHKKIKELKLEIDKLPEGVDWINPLMNFARACLLEYKYQLTISSGSVNGKK